MRSSVCSPGRSTIDTWPLTGPEPWRAPAPDAISATRTIGATFVTAFMLRMTYLPVVAMDTPNLRCRRAVGSMILITVCAWTPAAAQDSTRARLDSLAAALREAQARLDALE